MKHLKPISIPATQRRRRRLNSQRIGRYKSRKFWFAWGCIAVIVYLYLDSAKTSADLAAALSNVSVIAGLYLGTNALQKRKADIASALVQEDAPIEPEPET